MTSRSQPLASPRTWRICACPLGAAIAVAAIAVPFAANAAQDRARTGRFVIPGVAYDPDRGAQSAARPRGTREHDDQVRKSAAERDVGDGQTEKVIAPRVIPASDTAIYQDRPPEPDWLSTIRLGDGATSCTATVIGPRVLLTAAHCVWGRGRLTIDDGTESPINVVCTPHPRYGAHPVGRFFDYALCHLSRDYPRSVSVDTRYTLADLELAVARIDSRNVAEFMRRFVMPLIVDKRDQTDVTKFLVELSKRPVKVTDREGVKFDPDVFEAFIRPKLKTVRPEFKPETVRIERLSIAPGDGFYRPGDPQARRLLLAGYGCTDRRKGGGNDGNLSIGVGIVSFFGPAWIALGSDARQDSAIVCQGDSGGPAFRLLGRDPTGPRRLVAVNAYNISLGGIVQNRSFVAKTANPAFVGFFVAWRRSVGFPRVCGVDQMPQGLCRD